jgi:hypothetical protein
VVGADDARVADVDDVRVGDVQADAKPEEEHRRDGKPGGRDDERQRPPRPLVAREADVEHAPE